MLSLSRKRAEASAAEATPPKYPGIPDAMDGSAAIVEVETNASEAAGAYPITPSTQMGEGWALAVAAGKVNVNGRRLLFFEPEGEHAAAAVTAGMSMTGLRATNFSSGQGIAYMHESLYAAVGKRLTYVLNVAARAMTKHSLNVHAGHDDYHAVDDTGFFQLFAKDVQESADLNLIAHRIAELALNPGLIAQDGFLTSHVIESIRLPEPELVKEFLGDPADEIECPTPAQKLVFGEKRRRIPETFDFDYPAMVGTVQNQDSYAQGVAAQRPFYFDHVAELADVAMAEYAALTGRAYARATGYRLDDAEWVIAGQGSVVANAEAVADFLREKRGLKVGVLNLTMFRPFPADLVTKLLRGKKGVAVLERTDQPLAVDPPLLREIRAAMGQAVENGRHGDAETRGHGEPRSRGLFGKGNGSATSGNGSNGNGNSALPFPALATIPADEVPDFYSGGFGFGSRDLQPGDLVAAVENMLPEGKHKRQFYLGIEFIRKGTRIPKLQIWQEQLLEGYPELADLALESAGNLKILPPDAIALRIHSVGGWGAITMGKNVAMTAYELAGLNIKANPKYGSEKKGQPTTFYASFSHHPLKLNGELKFVDVVLSPDPSVFRHSNPLAGMSKGGVFVIQSDQTPEQLWASLPATAQRDIIEREIKVYGLDGFSIAGAEASDAELRYRMQGAAFMGAFFRTSPIAEREGLDEKKVFDGIESQLRKKFGKLGERVVQDNLRVIRRGYEEVKAVKPGKIADEVEAELRTANIPALLNLPNAREGLQNPGRFWEQVCTAYATGSDPIADPFAAVSEMPAVSSAFRDMTGIRMEVPDFIAEKCTGCNQCWTQCPDAAIPGLVNTPEQIVETAVRVAGVKTGRSLNLAKQVSKHVAKEVTRLVKAERFSNFGHVLSAAYGNVADKLGYDAAKRAALDEEFRVALGQVEDFPLARTAPFFDNPEKKAAGTGGLLSITINPEACKGCNVCVAVCPEHALVTVKQDEKKIERLRKNWEFWQELPDTDNRYISVSNIEEGIGVLPMLLLKKDTYRSMAGGDGACMGCGEKTTVHLVVSAVEALMQPRVAKLVSHLDELIERLDGKARSLLAAGADLDAAARATAAVQLPLDAEKHEQLGRINAAIHALKELRWRYVEGPGGRGRAALGIANSTGCSSVWASTFPFNPYPFPWANHLFQDSPSLALGIFEGHMRKMADAFVAIRRAELIAEDGYAAAEHEPFFQQFDWRQFTDEEFGFCPPILAIGGDGAMFDIGFQNLSRMMASGKPIRALILDTQVYSNTGGQACTSGYTGQVADMSAYGKAQHGKVEVRKEIGLVALAHRGTYVLQSSQASPAHLLAGVIRGLATRRPAVFNIYTPCPVEHGFPDDWAPRAARLALESRAFPYLRYDPDAGKSIAECLSLDGNPELDATWPTYELEYVDEKGEAQKIELPMTIADWAATEARFKKHFKRVKPEEWNEDMVPFHEYIALPAEEREGKTPFVYTLDDAKKLQRLSVAAEIVRLTEDRLLFWAQLLEMAGVKAPPAVEEAVAERFTGEYEAKLEALRAEYEAKMAALQTEYPRLIARRMAEGLLRATGDGRQSVADLLKKVESTPGLDFAAVQIAAAVTSPLTDGGAPAIAPAAPPTPSPMPAPGPAAPAPAPQAAAVAPAPAAAASTATAVAEAGGLAMEPYIESERCTTCNECTNRNRKMFVYNAQKQAIIKDAKAGTFAQIVQAAETCPAGIIHPGTPLNPKEKDLAKWIERAKPFN